jgi:hypothetical protein
VQLQAWLSTAQNAYALLMSGGKPVTVSYDGKSVTYSQASVANLAAFIQLLQSQLGMGVRRRAIRPFM